MISSAKLDPKTNILNYISSDYAFFILSSLLLMTLKIHQTGIGLDSAIYASVARNIAENGTWLNPSYTEFYHTPFAEHPPLFFWLQAIVFIIFGANDVTARFVSLFSGLGSVLLTYVIGSRIIDRRFGFLAALVLLLTINFLSMCSKTFIEIFFFFCILLSIYGLVRARQENTWFGWFTFGAGLGFAFMAKGIVVIGYLAGLALFLLFNRKMIKPGLWSGTFVAFLIPLFYIILESILGKNYFFSYYFGHQVLSRSLQSNSNHNYFEYTRQIINMYWPWLPLLLLGIYFAVVKKNLFIKFFCFILFAYLFFHSISYRLNWQYFANVYVFGAFISAYGWYNIPKLYFGIDRFKQIFFPIILGFFLLAQVLPFRVHEFKDAKLLSFTPYIEQIFENHPRRFLFTQNAFGKFSTPAKAKWYWHADTKYSQSLDDLLTEYKKDRRFSFVFVNKTEVHDLVSRIEFTFQPIAQNDDVVLLAEKKMFNTNNNMMNTKIPEVFLNKY